MTVLARGMRNRHNGRRGVIVHHCENSLQVGLCIEVFNI